MDDGKKWQKIASWRHYRFVEWHRGSRFLNEKDYTGVSGDKYFSFVDRFHLVILAAVDPVRIFVFLILQSKKGQGFVIELRCTKKEFR